MKKEKLNKKDTEKVSGGYWKTYDDPKHGRFKDANGKTFDMFCDACGKELAGLGGSIVFPQMPRSNFCLDCALKMQQFIKNLDPKQRLVDEDYIEYNNPK